MLFNTPDSVPILIEPPGPACSVLLDKSQRWAGTALPTTPGRSRGAPSTAAPLRRGPAQSLAATTAGRSAAGSVPNPGLRAEQDGAEALPRSRMRRAWLALALACALAHAGSAVRFSLAPGARRCFTEDLPTRARIAAEVRVSDGKGAMDIDVWVTTLAGAVLWHRRAPDHGKFAFTTGAATKTQHSGIDGEEDDDEDYGWVDETYRICVEHQLPPGRVVAGGAARTIALGLMESSLAGGDPGTLPAKDEAANRLQTRMRTMHETLSLVIGDLTKLQNRERKLVKRVKRTNVRIGYLSAIAVIVSVVTAVVQYQYYKQYFTQKKLC